MIPGHTILLLLLLSVTLVLGIDEETDDKKNVTKSPPDDKTGKVFSLFSVVTFKNTGCKSQSSMTTGQSSVRNGTCYTSSECSSKGGTASGNCAAGFGVCCLFLVTSTGSVINQNCTYLRNPSFPSVYSATSSLSYTVSKCSTDVCYIRLDFETFNILGPSVSSEPSAAGTTVGAECQDTFKVTTNTGQISSATYGQSIPIICGTNTGQHVYIDIGTVSTDTITLAFTFSTTTSTVRTWEIKVSQITCNNLNRPPNGCLQYFTTLTGRITTFNFYTTSTTSRHLDLQQYSVCIRRAQGFCCVQYGVCDGVSNSFTFDTTTTIAAAATGTAGLTDTYCSQDYITIPSSSQTGCSASNGKLNTRYCGNYLGFNSYTVVIAPYAPICDCTAPFQVGIRSDALREYIQPAAAIVSTSTSNRGACLDFQQVPCTTNG